MTIEKLMSQEEMDALAKKIWEERKADIEKGISYSIQSEMSLHIGNTVRHLVREEMMKFAKPLIESRKAEIEQRAKAIIDMVMSEIETVIASEIVSDFNYNLRPLLDTLNTSTSRIEMSVSNGLHMSLKKLEEERRRLQEEQKKALQKGVKGA